MALVSAVIQKMRNTLNEAAAGLWRDDVIGLLGNVNEGQKVQFWEVLKRLRSQGQMPSIDHPWLRHYVSVDPQNTAAGTRDYNLPANHAATLFVLYGSPLRPCSRVEPTLEALSSLSDMMGSSPGRALWCPRHPSGSTQRFRLYVTPGQEGIPQEIVPYEVWYLRKPTEHQLGSETLDTPDEYQTGVFWYACGQAVFKERKVADSFLQLAAASWERII